MILYNKLSHNKMLNKNQQNSENVNRNIQSCPSLYFRWLPIVAYEKR